MMGEHTTRNLNTTTNVLQVALPAGCSVQLAEERLRLYGEVCSIDLLPDATCDSVVVAFFDVRAAAKAAGLLGYGHCRSLPQKGNRRLTLPGNCQLEPQDMAGICGMQQDKEGDNYVVEFWDIRDCARLQAAKKLGPVGDGAAKSDGDGHGGKAPAAKQAPPLPVYVTPHTAGVAGSSVKHETVKMAASRSPSYGNCITAAQGMAPHSAAVPREVLISNLPCGILSDMLMEATFQQAGLENAVVNYASIPTSKQLGEVLVTLRNRDAAKCCVSHFHGRQWNTTPGGGGALVSATLLKPMAMAASVASLREKLHGFSPIPAEVPRRPTSSAAVAPLQAKSARKEAGRSERSKPWEGPGKKEWQTPKQSSKKDADKGQKKESSSESSSDAAPRPPPGLLSAQAAVFIPAPLSEEETPAQQKDPAPQKDADGGVVVAAAATTKTATTTPAAARKLDGPTTKKAAQGHPRKRRTNSEETESTQAGVSDAEVEQEVSCSA